jgi:hypothetical protein
VTDRDNPAPHAPGVSALVIAALANDDPTDLVARATRAAATTTDRQVVAIAEAYLAGDLSRAEALARDHLSDHPTSVVGRWVAARAALDATREATTDTTNRKDQP